MSTSIVLAPEESDPHLNRGTAEEALQDWSAAADDYLWILERDPQDDSALYNLANVRGSQGDWLEARELYGQAALARPGFIPVNLRATGVYGDLVPNKWEELFERYASGEEIAARAGSEVHGRGLAGAILTLLDAPIPKISGKAFHVSDIVTDTHTILAPLKAALQSPRPLPQRADQSAVSAMTTTRLNALGWRSGGMPLLSATLQTLVERFIDARDATVI